MPIPNSDYVPDPFPGIVSGADGAFRAPGSQGIQADSTGAVVETVKVSGTGAADGYGLQRIPQPVRVGDTNSLVSGAPVPASGDPLTGLGLGDVAWTGAGHGSVVAPDRRPWQQPNGG